MTVSGLWAVGAGAAAMLLLLLRCPCWNVYNKNTGIVLHGLRDVRAIADDSSCVQRCGKDGVQLLAVWRGPEVAAACAEREPR